MTLTSEVTNAMECTNAYLNNAQVVVVSKDKADQCKTLDDVSGFSFAVESGSAGEQAAIDNGFEYTSLTSQADAVMEVAAGTSDACIIDLLMAGAMVGEGTSYENLTYTVELTTEEYGIGCRKGSDLAAYINEQLKTYYADGSMETVAKQYGVQEAIIAQ
jgi:polar amino acid transport system substrate-binding protein